MIQRSTKRATALLNVFHDTDAAVFLKNQVNKKYSDKAV
jgi:hypothetical protein